MKKRSSQRKKIASQKAWEAREAALNDRGDTASEKVMNLDPSSIETGRNTHRRPGRLDAKDESRIRYFSGDAHPTDKRADKNNRSSTRRSSNETGRSSNGIGRSSSHIQTLLDETTSLEAEAAALKADNMALANAQKGSIQVSSGGSPTYAAIARTPPNSYPSNISPISSGLTVPSRYTDTPWPAMEPTCTRCWLRTFCLVTEEPRGYQTDKSTRRLRPSIAWRCSQTTSPHG